MKLQMSNAESSVCLLPKDLFSDETQEKHKAEHSLREKRSEGWSLFGACVAAD